MNETLMVREEREVAITSEQIDLIRRTIAKDATPEELDLFFYDNKRRGVHPLDKLIHFTKRKGKYTPITSIDFMRMRAADSGEYAGSDDAVFFGEGGPEMTATITVHRLVQGQRCPFTATARWTEYYPGDGDQGFMWRKMPHTMLAKCAEALALRKGFPQQTSGLYAAEEMAQMDRPEPPAITATVVHTATVAAPLPNVAPTDTIPFDQGEYDNASPVTTVVKVVTKHGTGPKGDWTMYFVTMSDGQEGSTFDRELGITAQAAMAAKQPVIATFERNGKYNNLVSLLQA